MSDFYKQYDPGCVKPACDETSPATCAPFALVTLETLTIKRFHNKDDWQTAMSAILARGQEFVALKYHAGAGRYVVPDRVE